MEHKIKAHVSIQKRFSHPPLQKCESCCSPPRYHCPFCAPALFKPTRLSRIREHLENHFRRAVFAGKYTIHKCGLQCRKQCHYHCLYCTATLIRKKDFKKHLLTCHKVHRPDVQGSTQAEGLMAPLLITEAFEFSSQGMSNHDGFEDLHMSTDSDDQNSHEASSSHGFTIRDCGYEPEKPVSFKRHQTVQTNFDKPQDCDEFYFMNLAKLFKKLSAPKKADVRMKIERILLEAGFE
nr:uncharacterized protein LOC109989458 isoform X1 [Labrus bergylta]